MARDVVQMVLELTDRASPALRRVGREVQDLDRKLTPSKRTLAMMGKAFKATAAGATVFGAAFAGIGIAGVKAGAQMEGFETRLTVLMGSAGHAKKRLDELFQIGSTTPFELPGLIEAEVNLRALGVNAEKTLPMVMDFAGAMGVDLASAAVEVGRAMQFGAGAVETISGRALRAQVELRTGADALKMSTSEFREAMIETLTDPDGIFAGGTEKLAATFDGMLSNLSDNWFKFTKTVSEAGAFKVSKEILRSILTILTDSADVTTRWAKVISDGVVAGMLLTMEVLGRILETTNMFSQSWMLAGVAFDQLIIKSAGINRSIKQMIISAGEFTGLMSDDTRLRLERDIVDSYKESGAARKRIQKAMFETLPVLEEEQNKLRKIRSESQRIRDNLDAIIKAEGVGDLTTERALTDAAKQSEGDPKKKPAAQKALEERQKAFDSAADSFASSMDRVRSAMMGPQKRSERMQSSLNALAESFRDAHLKAVELGNTSSEEFLKMAEDFEATSERMSAAIQQQQRVEGLNTGAQALQAAGGGASGMLSFAGAAAGPGSVAGPIVGAIQGLASLGQMGAEKFREDLKEFISNVIAGLVEVLPEIIGEVPLALIDALPELILGTLRALPKILVRLFVTLPISIAKGAGLALREIWETMKKWLANALEKISPKGIVKGIGSGIKSLGKSIGSVFGFQTGGYVRNTGLHMLHAGERIIPTSGASTQAVMAGAENIGSGQAVTINTSVVDPNAIDGLARMLQRELGSFGGGRDLSIFNTPAASAG